MNMTYSREYLIQKYADGFHVVLKTPTSQKKFSGPYNTHEIAEYAVAAHKHEYQASLDRNCSHSDRTHDDKAGTVCDDCGTRLSGLTPAIISSIS